MIKIWGRATSSNVQALIWAVAELGLTYERYDIGHSFGGTDTPEFLAMNPNGTVPVLQDGDNSPIWETGAILRYLAARYGDEAFWPRDAQARAQVDKWAEWAKLNVAQMFTVPVFWRVVRTAPSQQDPQAIASAVAALTHFLTIADTQLAHNAYLAGPTFTLADIQLGHVLFRYYDIAITRAPLPHLRAYYERLAAQPAFAAHVAISYDALRVSD